MSAELPVYIRLLFCTLLSVVGHVALSALPGLHSFSAAKPSNVLEKPTKIRINFRTPTVEPMKIIEPPKEITAPKPVAQPVKKTALQKLAKPAIKQVKETLKQALKAPTPKPQIKTAAKAPNLKPKVKTTALAPAGASQIMKELPRTLYVKGPHKQNYPSRAVKLGQEGSVIIHSDVSLSGIPINVRVFQPSGFPLLDKEALRTAKRNRYKPQLHGRTLQHIYNFDYNRS